MKIPMSMLNLMVGVPAIVASALLWMVALALMPPMLGLAGFLIGIVTLGALASGVGERAAAPLLVGGRTPTAAEQAALAPVLAHTASRRSDVNSRRLLVRQVGNARTPAVQLLGREHLVVASWMIEATYRGALSFDEATALVVHAEGCHRAERSRCEVAMLVLTLPWRAGAAIARWIGRVAWPFPLIGFAWAFRGVIGVVALMQQVDEGRPALGILVGTIVALTYLVPTANVAKTHRVEAAGDEAVTRHGLGEVMAKMLRRSGSPVALERLHRLDPRSFGSEGSPRPAAGVGALSHSGETWSDATEP